MTHEELIQYLKDNLSLDYTTTSEYIGEGSHGMYKDCHTIELILDGEVVSSISL